jgi:hypothetical protein
VVDTIVVQGEDGLTYYYFRNERKTSSRYAREFIESIPEINSLSKKRYSLTRRAFLEIKNT